MEFEDQTEFFDAAFRPQRKKTINEGKYCNLYNLLAKLIADFRAENPESRHKFISDNGRFIYHVAIIDYLQAFDLEKKLENFIKVWLY